MGLFRTSSLGVGAVLVGVGIAACGSTTADRTLSVNGAVAGNSLAAADVVAVETSELVDKNSWSILYIVIYDTKGACTAIQQNVDRANATGIEIEIDRIAAAPLPPVKTGSYPITVGKPGPDANGITQNVHAHFFKTDANCYGTVSDADGAAVDGTIEITSRSADDGVSGTFDLKFPNGSLQGAFDSGLCVFNAVKYLNGVRTCIQL